MDLSNVEGESEDEAKLRVAEQPRVIRRFYTCGSTKPLRHGFPLLKQRQAHMG